MKCNRIVLAISSFAAIVMLFGSCVVVNRVYFETLRPADTTINLKTRAVDLVNSHIISTPPPGSESGYEKWQVDSMVSFRLIGAVYSVFSESDRFIPQRVDTVFNQENSVDNRVELKRVDLHTKILRNPTKDYYTKLYTASVMVIYHIEWEIIGSENRVVYDRSYNDTVWIDGAKSHFETLYDLVDFERAVKHIVTRCGRQFAQSVTSHWRSTYRYIYVSGHNDFVVANYHVSQKDWERAELLWRNHLYSGNKNLAGKANYNMAVKSEKEGELLIALEYANKAKNLGFSPATELISIIEARIKNIAVIEGQIP